MTAAHCAERSGIEVILGDHDIGQVGESVLGEKRFTVARAILHEDYYFKNGVIRNDIHTQL